MKKVAIIGLSCLFPGAETPQQYWQNLIEQKDLTSLATAEEMGVDPNIFYSSHKGQTDKYYCTRGGYVRNFQFDPTGYKIAPDILQKLDLLYQWSLYVAKQALQDSGYLTNDAVLANCGVILGNLSFPTRSSHHLFAPIYHQALNSALQELLGIKSFNLKSNTKDVSLLNGNISSYPAQLIAKALSLSKINFALDAACASSLYSIKLACDYLLAHKADLMLAGAVSCGDPFFINMGFSIFQAYPENGRSFPLDKSSGGLVAGEGAGIVVLKRYQDAVRDRDRIYATINGIGLSNDGKGKFVLSPNPKGQVLAFERAYADARIDPSSIDYIECHVTGTPVGDITELNSMESFFGRYHHSPLLGSVKSNLGHLLTAAGIASLIKVILSLNKNLIPPTINISKPLKSNKGNIGGKQIVTAPIPWQKSHKFAAVSAFGFGGCNAHLVLEKIDSTTQSLDENSKKSYFPSPMRRELGRGKRFRELYSTEKLAIIGMDACFGGCDGLAAFNQTIYEGKQHFIPLPPQRWQGMKIGEASKGAYIKDFEFDFLRYKIPPKIEDRLIPQQLLMLKVADRAIQDAGLKAGQNIAVIVAMETELALHQYRGRVDLDWQIREGLQQANITLADEQITALETIAKDSLYLSAGVNHYTSTIGNVMASRIAALWDFTGAAFTVSAGEQSVFQALEVAQMMLSNSEVDAVVLGAVDLAGGIESVWLHQQSAVFDNSNILVGEGAGAIILKRHKSATEDKDKIYAAIEELSLIQSPPLGQLDNRQVTEPVGINLQDIGYLEICGSGITQKNSQTIDEVLRTHTKQVSLTNDNLGKFTCCLGTVEGNIGHNYAASGMASLIKTALCLKHRYLPATPPKIPLKDVDMEHDSPFYLTTKSKPWLLKPDTLTRKIAINGINQDGSYAYVILSEDRFSHSYSSNSLPSDIKIESNSKSINKSIILGGESVFATLLNPQNKQKFSSPVNYRSNNHILMPDNVVKNDLKIIQLQINRTQQLIEHNFNNNRLKSYSKTDSKSSKIIWDEADLLEFAEGNIASVFGKDYAIIDTYSRRVRLPMPPYLLVSRVTKIDAQKGSFKPSSITTEYDIPDRAWYSVDGQIPLCVAVESGQCDLLLISYLGIDFENKGDLVYRLLDCTLTFLDDLPKEGETLRYDIKINSFVRNGNNLLFFFSYECFVGDKMILKMDGGCAGFFSDEQLEQGKGIIVTEKELAARKQIKPQQFTPLLVCTKSSFDESDLLHLTKGNLAACFGDHYEQYGLNSSLRLPPAKILMIDRVTSVDFKGGAWGLGLIIGEKSLEPEHWYFPCHFKDDRVLAGSLIAEGCSHLLEFYMLYLGLHTCTKDSRFQPIYGLPQVVRCRGQITPISARLIYRMEITEIGFTPYPYVKCNVDIILQGKTVVNFQDLGLQIKEKKLANLSITESQKYAQSTLKTISVKNALLTEEQVREFCLGSVAKCFGEEFSIYDRGIVKASRMPNTHLNLVSRVLEVKAQRHHIKPDSTIITEYDVPDNPWYYHQNSSETIPYSILMEMGLQPCGFLSAYLGTTLLYPDSSLYFRNLDGEGKLLKNIDIRGKTITNTATLLSSTNISGIILQNFSFQLVCNGETFYQGEASFGHFSPKALGNQVGLDRRRDIPPWHETENKLNFPAININLRTKNSRNQYYKSKPNKPHYCLGNYQLDLLNNVKIIEGGGKYQQGYIYAQKEVKLTDWYFKCHFYQDPVMPGSLGIEAMIQAMQVYALHLDLGQHLRSPRFVQLNNHKTVWKYRGQIPPEEREIYLEIHISQLDISSEKIIVIGDASLWKPNLRIYEVKDLAICILESY